MSLNQVVLVGNLTRDPETREVGDTIVCNFSVATNKRYKDRNDELVEKPMFIECTAWARTGEVIADNFVKGQEIGVVGELEFDRWEDDDGNPRSKHKVRVFSFTFTGSKADNDKLREQRDNDDDDFDDDDGPDIPF